MLSGEKSLEVAVAEVETELIELRRAIHRHPEPAGCERETAGRVAEALRGAGLDEVRIRVGGHGVVGILNGGTAGPTVAYRAELDAVVGEELTDHDIRSRVPGVGHLCGHDLHMAIAVGVARVLARQRDQLRGRVVFVFQPAEETLTGAQAMIDDGVLEWAKPQEIYALHCAPLPVGTVAVMPGTGVSGHDNVDLELIGPTEVEGAERLATAIARLSTVQPPSTAAGFRQHLADLQRPDGPLAAFVFAGARTDVDSQGRSAHLHGWVKAWPDEVYPTLRDEIRRLVRRECGTAVSHRLAFRDARVPAMVCSPHLSDAAADHFRTVLGPHSVTEFRALLPFNGEDFALFLERVPGAMFFLGVANEATGADGQVHAPTFAADEQAIGIGTRIMAGWLSARLYALAG